MFQIDQATGALSEVPGSPFAFPAVFCVIFAIGGYAGGSASFTPPPQIVTPSGTSTLTISLAATSPSGQPLQLQPIQLTLTVK